MPRFNIPRYNYFVICNFTILRLSALLGKYSNNMLSKILNKSLKKTTLSKNSVFNYILYEDVLSFIKIVLNKKNMGIINLIASKNIRLENAVNLTNKKIKYGKYKYVTYSIKNDKIKNYTKIFNNTSKQNLKIFINANS